MGLRACSTLIAGLDGHRPHSIHLRGLQICDALQLWLEPCRDHLARRTQGVREAGKRCWTRASTTGAACRP